MRLRRLLTGTCEDEEASVPARPLHEEEFWRGQRGRSISRSRVRSRPERFRRCRVAGISG